MSGPRPLASLSPALLARKGAARPAMRPQGYAPESGGAGTPAPSPLDDLGWNDMGTAAPGDAIPPVLVEREALATAIEAPPAVREISIATAVRLRRETAHASRVALTLRLDADRHLRLRLASAISNQSAQVLLTQALDALIDAMPTVAALVACLPATPTPKKGKSR